MKNKKLIRLTESDLHRIVRESVNKVLNERIIQIGDDDYEDGKKMKRNVPNTKGRMGQNQQVKHNPTPNANGISYYNGRAIELS